MRQRHWLHRTIGRTPEENNLFSNLFSTCRWMHALSNSRCQNNVLFFLKPSAEGKRLIPWLLFGWLLNCSTGQETLLMKCRKREMPYKLPVKSGNVASGQARADQPISWGFVGLFYSICITAQLCENICFPHLLYGSFANIRTEECSEALDFEEI